MLKIYGSMMCPDCVQCRKDLDKAAVAYEYLDVSENLGNLKEFLRLRDQNTIFDSVRSEGKIGIPCIVSDNGDISLEWNQYLNK